jgi:sugar phosphate isomerase/epimerase
MESSIEIGFSNNIYDNPADVVGSARQISEDFRVIEIELAEEAQPAVFDANPEDYTGIVRGLRTLAQERRLCYSVHAAWYGPHTNLTSPDSAERRASAALLARSIRFAADIGANIVTCHPGYRRGQDDQQLVENLVDSLDDVRDLTASEGITLCVENMGAERPSHALLPMEKMFEVSERANVSVCMDIVHLASVFPAERALFDAMAAMAPIVRHVHLSDMIRPKHKHLPIGKGDLPLEDILRQLAMINYRGQAIVEEFTPGWPPEEYLSGAVAFRDRARVLSLVS